MSDAMTEWWAKGLLFENCSCQLVCPGHVHFSQTCYGDRCVGYWAVRVDEGAMGEVPLGRLKAVVLFESPVKMIDGGWKESIYLDSSATPEQREALRRIFSGEAGGPWGVLARFVSDVRFLDAEIEIEETPTSKRVGIGDLLKSTIEAIRGRDRGRPVRFENMFNQIHASSHVLALGDAEGKDGVIRFSNRGSHSLWSSFDWAGDGAA